MSKARLPRKLKKAIKNGKYGIMGYLDGDAICHFKPKGVSNIDTTEVFKDLILTTEFKHKA